MKIAKQNPNDQAASRRRHLFGFGAVAALALMLLAITLNALNASHMRKDAGYWRAQTLNTMVAAAAARSAIHELILYGAGYQITGDPGLIARYRQARAAVPKRMAELRALTRANPQEQANIGVLQTRLDALLERVDRAHMAARRGLRGEAAEMIQGSAQDRAVETVLAAIDTIEAAERRLLTSRETALVRAQRLSEFAQAGLAAVALIFLGVVTWAGITASRARMKTLGMEEQLRRAATTDELTGLLKSPRSTSRSPVRNGTDRNSRWRWSISIISRASTTVSAMPAATKCCASSPKSRVNRCGRPM